MTDTAAATTNEERRTAKIKELRRHLEELTRSRAGFTAGAVILLLMSPLGLFIDGLVTFAVATIAVCLLGISVYLSFIYIRETRTKIERLEKLMAAAASKSAEAS